MSQSAFSLFEIQEFIRRVIALNLPEAVWIRAEIAQVKESRGHVYLDLIEKEAESDTWIAQAPAVIWATAMRQLRKNPENELSVLLQEGMEILFKARIDYHERFGLKLVIEEIDPAYTVGQLALLRRHKYQQIREEGLVGKNRQATLPLVLQRIAVISSGQAAGFQDFQNQLLQNPYGYRFECRFFASAMQGNQVESEVLAQLQTIQESSQDFDCVVIIRGGGARLDLAGFDSVPLCREIAAFPIPVFTGIGHDADETLIDAVAFAALKTPTAVAEHLLQHNLAFESQLLEWSAFLKYAALEKIHQHKLSLEQQQGLFQRVPLLRLNTEENRLRQMEIQLSLLAGNMLQSAGEKLETAEKICTLMSIENTLERGFSITLLRDRPVKSPAQVKPGDVLTTLLAGGSLNSEVK